MSDTLPIDHVSVHPDGALVTRRGTLTAQGGVVKVRRLPLLLDASSLRVQREDGPIGMVQLSLDLAGLDTTPTPEAQLAVWEAERAVRQVQALLQHLTTLRARLDGLTPARPAKDDHSPPPVQQIAAWGAARQALEGWAEDLDTRILAQSTRLREAEEALRLAQDHLASRSTESLMRRWLPTRVAQVEVGTEGPVTLQLSYRVEGALWTPAYTLHADGAFTQGRLTVRALVAQGTGEDWTGVALALCTAPSARAVDLPELPALRLGSRQPPRRSGWRPLPADLDALFPADLPQERPASPEPILEEAPVRKLAKPVVRRQVAREERPLDADEEAEGAFAAADALPEAPMAMRAPPPPAPAAMRSRAAMPPAMPQAMNAPGAPPVGAAMEMARGGGPFGGAAAPKLAPPPPEPEPELAGDALDYAALRVGAPGASPGMRGRLQRSSLEQELTEAGAPPEAGRRLRQHLDRLRALLGRVRTTRLPPNHVLPGPVQGVDLRYDASGRVDLPSDGGLRALVVRAEAADVAVRYLAVAREDARVYRRAQVRLRDGTAPWVAGPVDLYLDDALALSLPWAGSPGGGEFSMDVGVEDRLKLARNVRYSEETAGLLRGSRRLITEIEVQLASALPHPVQVELYERLPVPVDNQVTVERTASEPQAQEWTGEPGGPILKGAWVQRVALAAGAQAKATLRYTATMANNLELVGGDRRG